jgi:glycosyltransferase involved in cell wall biosynthesis
MSDAGRFSVVILTLNEERNLPGCLASVAGCDDILVVDSGSTDRTAEIARAAGARVLVNRFSDFAQQRNFADEHGGFRHDWVFHLDADEQMTPELMAECARVAAANPALDGFYAAPRMMFHGQWLRRCTDWPAWQARFVRHRAFRFIQSGHGQREAPDMRMGRLQAGYTHDISVESEADWEAKHRRYARQEAGKILQETASVGTLLQRVRSGPPLARRRALKHLSYSLPARPLLRFVYQYFLRGGFLDGRGAFGYCRRLARYEGFAAAELKRQRAGRLSV